MLGVSQQSVASGFNDHLCVQLVLVVLIVATREQHYIARTRETMMHADSTHANTRTVINPAE
jgi:hypothetical protein